MTLLAPTDERAAAIQRGRARATAEIELAIADARAAIARGIPEIVESGGATGNRLLVPARQMAVGMLAFIEDSFARAQNRPLP